MQHAQAGAREIARHLISSRSTPSCRRADGGSRTRAVPMLSRCRSVRRGRQMAVEPGCGDARNVLDPESAVSAPADVDAGSRSCTVPGDARRLPSRRRQPSGRVTGRQRAPAFLCGIRPKLLPAAKRVANGRKQDRGGTTTVECRARQVQVRADSPTVDRGGRLRRIMAATGRMKYPGRLALRARGIKWRRLRLA